MNFKALDPEYEGAGLTSASARDREVFEAFSADITNLRATATAIRKAIQSDELLRIWPVPDYLEYEAIEGRLLVRTHLSRERSAAISAKKKRL